MPRHLTVNDETAVCGPFLGELAADSYTTDPDNMDCMECEALLGRPQDATAVARAYARGTLWSLKNTGSFRPVPVCLNRRSAVFVLKR